MYSTIENWWGDELTTETAEKASTSPAYQLRAFLEDVASPDLTNYSPALPPMERGTLRPLVSGNPVEFDPSDSVDVALRILLYAHEVALENDFIGRMFWLRGQPIDNEARGLVRDVLSKLADLRPFIHQGIVHLTPVRSPAIHPAYSMWEYTAIEHPEVRDVAHQLLVENGLFADEEITEGLLAGVLTFFFGATKIALHRMSQGTANPLTRTEAERALVNALLVAKYKIGADRWSIRLPAFLYQTSVATRNSLSNFETAMSSSEVGVRS